MAAPRSASGLTTGQGASELTSIPLPASARRGPAQTPAPPAVPAQAGVDALLGTSAATVPLQIEPLPEVRVRSVSVPLPQPSQETIQLQGMRLEAEGALRDEMFRAEADRQRLAEQYAAAVAAPLPEMEARPQLPDAPVMRNWQEAVQEQMPLLALIAVLGAAGTRQPLINAMNAMTGATLALQKGQYDEYERNLRQWEVESKVALDKVQAWQDKRKEILNSRNLTIEQKKAMLEVMDSNAGKRRELFQGEVDRITYYLEQSQKADKAIQDAREATAKLQLTVDATKARLKLAQDKGERDAAMHALKVSEKELELANMERTRGELSVSQFRQASALKKQFDTETKELFDGLEAMETILTTRDQALGAQLAQNFLISLAPGRQTTNQQLNAIKNTGDLGTRIENTYSMFLTGKPGPQAMAELSKLIREMAPLYRRRIDSQIERVGNQVQTLFNTSGDDVQLKVFEFVVPETIPGGGLTQ
jgi:hypothetical protein